MACCAWNARQAYAAWTVGWIRAEYIRPSDRFEIGCLAPVMVSFFYGTGRYGEHGDAWNSVVLFGGIALSRIGLWSFDLCQVSGVALVLLLSSIFGCKHRRARMEGCFFASFPSPVPHAP